MSSEGCCYDCGKLPLDCNCEDGDEDTWPPRVGDVWRSTSHDNGCWTEWKLVKEERPNVFRGAVVNKAPESIWEIGEEAGLKFAPGPDKNPKNENATARTLIDRKEI